MSDSRFLSCAHCDGAHREDDCPTPFTCAFCGIACADLGRHQEQDCPNLARPFVEKRS